MLRVVQVALRPPAQLPFRPGDRQSQHIGHPLWWTIEWGVPAVFNHSQIASRTLTVQNRHLVRVVACAGRHRIRQCGLYSCDIRGR